jgi:hypothetical protein
MQIAVCPWPHQNKIFLHTQREGGKKLLGIPRPKSTKPAKTAVMVNRPMISRYCILHMPGQLLEHRCTKPRNRNGQPGLAHQPMFLRNPLWPEMILDP